MLVFISDLERMLKQIYTHPHTVHHYLCYFFFDLRKRRLLILNDRMVRLHLFLAVAIPAMITQQISNIAFLLSIMNIDHLADFTEVFVLKQLASFVYFHCPDQAAFVLDVANFTILHLTEFSQFFSVIGGLAGHEGRLFV